MGLFRKNKKTAGWMVVCLQADNICATSIKRVPAAKPLVELAACFALGTSSPADGLEKFAKEMHAERFDCINLLMADEYQMLSVEAPNVPVDELKTAIRWRLKDMLDFHIDDATVDVLDVPMDKNAASRNHSMYAIAARNQVIEQRQALFSEAKLALRVIDIPEMAQRNIATLLEPEGRGVALLSFDNDGGLLTVSYGGELYLSRRIDVTLQHLAQSDLEQKIGYYERVTLELQRSMDHFDRQYHHISLGKLILAPVGNAASDLIAYLAEHLYMPVEPLDLETILDFSAVPELKSPDMQQRHFMSLGAALRLEEAAL
jgi:MSHA biogenesis protein MshI